MKIYLIRHTKVDVPPGTCYGQTDVPVMNSFQEEAVKVKSNIEGISFTHCFASPLTRCRKLAETIVPDGLTIQYDDRLKELNFGEWEGKQWSNFEGTFDAKKWFNNYMTEPCPGGESYTQLIERVRLFLNELSQLPDNSTVMVVSHGGPIRAFLVLLENIDPEKVFDIEIDYGEVKQLLTPLNPLKGTFRSV